MEYVIVIACAVMLDMLLNVVMNSTEVQSALKDKIMQVLTGQNKTVSFEQDNFKERSLEEQYEDPYGKPKWIRDLSSGFESLKGNFKKTLSETWKNLRIPI